MAFANRPGFHIRKPAAVLPRARCSQCRSPLPFCYCSQLRPFASDPRFAILIHRLEMRRSIATGWMTHLTLSNSVLLQGMDFSQNEKFNALLEDPTQYPVLLYPGPRSTNLTPLSLPERKALFPADRQLLVVIVDGTWSHAKRMKRLSSNLQHLPQISFTPPAPSGFAVRRQPRKECYSTIESAHLLISLLGGQGHDDMLKPFHWMVEKQAAFMPGC